MNLDTTHQLDSPRSDSMRQSADQKPPALLSREELLRRDCVRPLSDPRFRPPTGHEIRSLFDLSGWTHRRATILLGVSYTRKGSNTIDRWCLDRGVARRQMPNATWRLALYESGLQRPAR